MPRLASILVSIALLTACTAPSTEDAASTEAAIVDGECAGALDEDSCMDQPGCAWGDRGGGAACFHVGEIDAQPGSGDPGGGARLPDFKRRFRRPIFRRPIR